MRYLSIMLLLAFFATMLEASYYRSIRVVAYPKKSSAEKAAKRLENFIATKQNLVEFQDQLGFRVGVVKAGKYYMVVMEPFKDEVKVLQETLDTLRLKYKTSYVRKIKGKSSFVKKKTTTKKETTKKKQTSKKVVEKKVVAKKLQPKKEFPKKIVTKKVVAKKLQPKKELPKKTVIKKVESKKELSKKAVAKKVPQVAVMVEEPMVEVVTMQQVKVASRSTSHEKNQTLNRVDQVEQNKTIAKKVVEEKTVGDQNSSAAKALEKILQNKTSIETNTTVGKNVTNVTKIKTVVPKKNIPTQKNSTLPQVETPSQESSIFDKLAPLYEHIVVLWQALFVITLLAFLVMYKKYTTSQNRNDELVEQENEDSTKIKKLLRETKNRDRYIAHVNRELSSPIESILELSDELKESELASKSKRNIQKLESAAQSISLIFEDISDLKALEENSLVLNESEFNINHVLKNVLYIAAIDAKKNNIALSLEVDKNVPAYLVGDARRIEHILKNILNSAIKRTKAGNIALKLVHSIDDDDIITLSFRVQDSGKGMSQDEIENAFKLYHDTVEYESSLGLGLGLYISKELITLMNGEISIDNQSRGTTVVFSIKVNVNDPQERRHYRVPSEEYLGKNVLLVESSERNLAALKNAFEYFNYNVFHIASFEESTVLEDAAIDLLVVNQHKLTDIALENIQDIQKHSNCRLLVLGDIYTPIDSDLIESFKVDAVLTTPLIQQDVFDTLTNIYKKESMYSLYVQKLQENRVEVDDKLADIEVTDVETSEDNTDTIKGDEESQQEAQEGERVEVDEKPVEIVVTENSVEIQEEVVQRESDEEILEPEEVPQTEELAKEDDSVREEIAVSEEEASEEGIEISKEKEESMQETQEESLESDDVIQEATEPLAVEVGIANCDNDENFYNSMLEEFKTSYENSSNTFEALCEVNDFEKARYYAMDIKDLAINIGAYELSESVAAMEYEFEKAEKSDWIKYISEYAQNLDRLLTAIDKRLQ